MADGTALIPFPSGFLVRIWHSGRPEPIFRPIVSTLALRARAQLVGNDRNFSAGWNDRPALGDAVAFQGEAMLLVSMIKRLPLLTAQGCGIAQDGITFRRSCESERCTSLFQAACRGMAGGWAGWSFGRVFRQIVASSVGFDNNESLRPSRSSRLSKSLGDRRLQKLVANFCRLEFSSSSRQ